jgi:hypothetical protein
VIVTVCASAPDGIATEAPEIVPCVAETVPPEAPTLA